MKARVDAPLAAPNTDDDEHRNEAALEEEVEENHVERREDAEHQRFQNEKRDHVFLDAILDRYPACQNAKGHQECRQDYGQYRNAVDAHFIFQRTEPGSLFVTSLAGMSCSVLYH